MQLATFGLAVYFATYVVTRSSFPPVDKARGWIGAHAPVSIGYLVTCAWCSGFWVSALIVGAAAFIVDVPEPVMMVLACAAIAGLVQFLVDTVGEVIELMARDRKL